MYVWALCIVALLLLALTYAVRFLNRTRVAASGKRLVSATTRSLDELGMTRTRSE